MIPKFFEGVPYYPYRVRFRLADGRVRRWIRWAPAYQYAVESLCRELESRFRWDELKPGSGSVERL